MKKISLLSFVFFFILMIVGCDKQNMTYTSHPVGYAVISDTFVAKGSLNYVSDKPYNVNWLSMELYYLPSVWGEIEVTEEMQITENDPNFVIIDYNSTNQKVFAKYVHIGENTWTAEIDTGQVKYVNQDGVNILEILSNEQEAKAYVEALEFQNAYFLDFELVMLSGYLSKLDTISAEDVIQKVSEVQVVEILWAETISLLPDFSTYFPDYDSTKINTLFQRVFDKAEQDEFRTGVFIG
ncbi:MAG: hypothetical protein KJ971_04470 [Firmicutes bacterium]|nr:hypothetical protein [Bacillota bacterium]